MSPPHTSKSFLGYWNQTHCLSNLKWLCIHSRGDSTEAFMGPKEGKRLIDVNLQYDGGNESGRIQVKKIPRSIKCLRSVWGYVCAADATGDLIREGAPQREERKGLDTSVSHSQFPRCCLSHLFSHQQCPCQLLCLSLHLLPQASHLTCGHARKKLQGFIANNYLQC